MKDAHSDFGFKMQIWKDSDADMISGRLRSRIQAQGLKIRHSVGLIKMLVFCFFLNNSDTQMICIVCRLCQ